MEEIFSLLNTFYIFVSICYFRILQQYLLDLYLIQYFIDSMSCGGESKHKQVQQYYGKTLCGSESLLTNACTVGKSCFTPTQKKVLSLINPQITSKFYGCGSPIPECLQGKTVVDLGCGTGVDTYIVSYLAKQEGTVIGVDMTASQLELANKYLQQMTQKYNFSKPNIKFVESKIQNLPLQDKSVDIVISNCVINLTPNKKDVFSEIKRVLKPGGQLYFSDMYADRRVSQKIKENKVLWGQGLSGALYTEDFRRIMSELGFKDCRVISKKQITVSEKLINLIGKTKYYSITYRCFNLSDLEDKCQDYGQKATYLGGIEDSQQVFRLDNSHVFKKGEPVQVCGNTASMLKQTRFGKYFQVDDRGEHLGEFDCRKGSKEEACSKVENACGAGSCC